MFRTWICVNSFKPSSPNSTPTPERFEPPKGRCGCSSPCLFTHTVPDVMDCARAQARSLSFDQIEPPRTYLDAVARATASFAAEYLMTGKTAQDCSSSTNCVPSATS